MITAAGQGIGRATAKAYAAVGAKVFATDINIDHIRDIPSVEAVRLDVTDKVAIESFAADVGPVDVLFNCAGFVHSRSILNCS